MHPIFYITIPIGLLVVIFLGFALWVHRSAPLEIKLKYQHLFPSALPPDFISEVERQAIERGELKIEPYQTSNKLVLALIGLVIFVMRSNFYLVQKAVHCELIFGLAIHFINPIVFDLGLLFVLLIAVHLAYQTYQKALATGFLTQRNRQNSKYRLLKPATQRQIKQDFWVRMGIMVIFLGMIIGMNVLFLNIHLRKAEMTNAPKTQLPTYQIASQKLQQQCLAKLEK